MTELVFISRATEQPEGDEEALDAYSRTVTAVAERLTPSVANVRVRRGGGSGVVITPDGFLLTSAHVVARTRSGSVTFADGRDLRFDVSARTRSPTSLSCVSPASSWRPRSSATPTHFGSASWSSPSATRTASPAP